MPLPPRRLRAVLPAVVSLVLAAVAPDAAAQKRVEARPLSTTFLTGRNVPVLPLAFVQADSAAQADSAWAPYRAREVVLPWVDSALADVLANRASEVNWILPPQLRRMAKRAPTMVGDPDRMGQQNLRAPNATDVPDPLRSRLRTLVALADGRNALVPAALYVTRDPAGGGLRLDLMLALADARSGTVLWRSLASGTGGTPEAALRKALDTLLPPDTAP